MNSTEILPLLVAERDRLSRAIDILQPQGKLATEFFDYLSRNPSVVKPFVEIDAHRNPVVDKPKRGRPRKSAQFIEIDVTDRDGVVTPSLNADKRKQWTPQRKAAHSKRMAKYWKTQRKAS